MTTTTVLKKVSYIQSWMDSVPGQTFMNYAYSWGASIVILGTLFKLTHLPGANFFLFLGMGTEVFVFFIAAFDRPFDKTDEKTVLTEEPEFNVMQKETAEQLQEKTEKVLEQIEMLSERLPETKDSEELKKTVNALLEVYKKQLERACGQLETIEGVELQMKKFAENLDGLNSIYGRMVDAVKTTNS